MSNFIRHILVFDIQCTSITSIAWGLSPLVHFTVSTGQGDNSSILQNSRMSWDSPLISALQNGQPAFPSVSCHWLRHGMHSRWPHGSIRMSLSFSAQILHSCNQSVIATLHGHTAQNLCSMETPLGNHIFLSSVTLVTCSNWTNYFKILSGNFHFIVKWSCASVDHKTEVPWYKKLCGVQIIFLFSECIYCMFFLLFTWNYGNCNPIKHGTRRKLE